MGGLEGGGCGDRKLARRTIKIWIMTSAIVYGDVGIQPMLYKVNSFDNGWNVEFVIQLR